MDLIPNQNDVRELLLNTGALRQGHFRNRDGTHSSTYLQLPLVMRHYAESKALSVGLSRLLRANDEVRRLLPNISVVTPATAGLPVAYGVSEALRAAQTYWAEMENGQLRFRQFMDVHAGEKVVLVDDFLRSGRKLRELRALVEKAGAQVLAVAVIVHQPTVEVADFDGLPLLKLLTLQLPRWDAAACPLCQAGTPLVETRL